MFGTKSAAESCRRLLRTRRCSELRVLALGLKHRTSQPACAKTCATEWPMVPSPSTATRRASRACPGSGACAADLALRFGTELIRRRRDVFILVERRCFHESSTDALLNRAGAPPQRLVGLRLGRDNANPRSGKQHTHLVPKRGCPTRYCKAARICSVQSARAPSARGAMQRLPGALLWPLKSAENLSFRSASVATHTHTSSPLAGCPTTLSHCLGLDYSALLY